MGKNSVTSRLNINGRFGWFIMEVPGFITMWAVLFGVKQQLGIETLPRMNYLMATIYVRCDVTQLSERILILQTIHYIYRSILSPIFLAPSVSPMHVSVAASAVVFNLVNGASLGGWLGGYGPITNEYWSSRMILVQLGLGLWIAGFAGNIYHDDELRALRRKSAREQAAKAEKEGDKQKTSVKKIYKIPQAGLFQYILYPHYFCEWFEWAGYWMIGGPSCVPAKSFLLNEIGTMLPQAVLGKKWYIEKFGKEKIGDRKAIIPCIL